MRVKGALLGLLLYCLMSAPLAGVAALIYQGRYEAFQERKRVAQIVVPRLSPRADAVCRDGWLSPSLGSGTCSWHSGVRYWASDLRQSLKQTWWGADGSSVVIILILWVAGAVYFIWLTSQLPLRVLKDGHPVRAV